MSIRAICVFSAVLIVLAVPALAVDPAPGVYTSAGTGWGSQDFINGRGSNSRPVPDVGIDNAFNSASWDGATLGTEWVFTCGISVSQVTQNNINGSGNGTIEFTTVYNSGTFWLSKNGPWGDGVNDLTGTINTLTRYTTLQYINWNPVAAVENVNTSGDFDGSTCVLEFIINNNVGLGDTDSHGPLPAGYPAFLDLACAANRTDGSWGDVKDIALSIFCPVPVEEATWGHIKALYR
jgi:hypothetical protein